MLVVVLLSVLSTLVCLYFGLYIDFPMTLIGIAIVFPIVFSISGAYKSREASLKYYWILKSFGRAIYLASRDWIEKEDIELQNSVKNSLQELLFYARKLLWARRKYKHNDEKESYKILSKISLLIRSFRKRNLASGEVSRCNQYLSKMINAFEDMKHIYQYRTPRTLRAYSKVFVIIVPVIYWPYFAELWKDTYTLLALIVPILFSIILVSLDNIQEHLENPFDQVWEDDIKINAEKFVDSL